MVMIQGKSEKQNSENKPKRNKLNNKHKRLAKVTKISR